jgi:hypothetical protein
VPLQRTASCNDWLRVVVRPKEIINQYHSRFLQILPTSLFAALRHHGYRAAVIPGIPISVGVAHSLNGITRSHLFCWIRTVADIIAEVQVSSGEVP